MPPIVQPVHNTGRCIQPSPEGLAEDGFRGGGRNGEKTSSTCTSSPVARWNGLPASLGRPWGPEDLGYCSSAS